MPGRDYDNLLLDILQNEGQILPFLDVIFSFLYRRTDFYRIQNNPGEKFGFPPGVADMLVRTAFAKYQKIALKDQENEKLAEAESTPPVIEEIEVESTTADNEENQGNGPRVVPIEKIAPTKKSQPTLSEGFNGAVHDNYAWSQTIHDLDVRIKVPEEVVSAKSVQVKITAQHLTASIQEDGKWQTIADGDLRWKVNVGESVWSLVPGEHIHISLEKVEQRWWDSLLEGEPKIDTTSIDTTQNYTDLDADSQAAISRLMFDEQQKRLGKPTSQQLQTQELLRKAWNIEGSPFKGQEFDPSVVSVVIPQSEFM